MAQAGVKCAQEGGRGSEKRAGPRAMWYRVTAALYSMMVGEQRKVPRRGFPDVNSGPPDMGPWGSSAG